MLIQETASHPPPYRERYEDRMEGPDMGIVNAWLAGLEHRRSNVAWRTAAEAGELPVLPYRGGVERKIKKKLKIGALHYLAMWQGLRGENLNIDTDKEPVITCSRFGVMVQYTFDFSKFEESADE